MSPSLQVHGISAVAADTGIYASNGQIPWTGLVPAYVKYFRKMTLGHAVVMGLPTFLSLPEKDRPLADRINMVVSRDHQNDLPEGVLLAASPQAAISIAEDLLLEKIFFIGGKCLLRSALNQGLIQRLHVSYIGADFDPMRGGDKANLTYFRELLCPGKIWTNYVITSREYLSGVRVDVYAYSR